MRLCYIKLNYFPPYAGGGTRMAYTLFRHLAKKHEVHVVTHAAPGYSKPEEILDGVHVHRTTMKRESYSPLSGIRFFMDARKLIRKLHSHHSFDVVHGYSAFSFVGLFMRLLRLKNTRVCFTYEAYPVGLKDLLHMQCFYHLSGLVPHKLWSDTMHRTYAVSNYSLGMLREKGIDMSRAAISYPPICLDNYQQLPNRQELSNVFVYASSCTVWKGIEDIIEAMRLLKKKRSDFRVIMFSPGISRKLAWTPDSKFSIMIHNYGLSENHEFINEPRSDIGNVMARSRAVIAPFRSMLGTLDIPFSLLEGMAVGVPVIGSKLGGIPEIVQDGKNGLLVQPQAPQQLADAMLKLLIDDDLCRRMGACGHEIVQGFSVDKIAESLIEDYSRD